MKVHLAMSCDFPYQEGPIPVWLKLAEDDKVKKHEVVNDPAQADIIIFPDLHLHKDFELQALRKHAYWKQYADKIVVYDERDKPVLPLRGIYVSMEKQNFDSNHHRTGSYHLIRTKVFAPFANQEPDL